MNVQVEKLEKNTAKMTVEVPVELFLEAIDKAYLNQKKNISVPGFRKGKVPKQIVEKMYGEGAFFEEAADILLMSEYPKAAKESGLTILTRPDVEITQIGKDKPFVFTAVVAIYPEITLGEYKGLEVPKVSAEVTDEDINNFLKREQDKNSRIITIDDRPSQMGDTVVLDYKGTVDGVEFDGGAAENYHLILGSNSFIPGFEDQLTGLNAGDSKDVKVTFPENYRAEELAGKEAVFACKIHKVEKKELPEIDDEFAQEVSEFDTLEEYKADIANSLKETKEKEAKNAVMMAAVEKASQNAKIDLPDILIDETAVNMVNRIADRLKAQGMSLEQYLKLLGTTYDRYKQSMVPQAITDLRNQFTLEKIAEIENLNATEEDFEERLEAMAEGYGTTVEDVKKLLTDEIKAQMIEEMRPDIAAKFVGEHAVEV